MWRFFYSAGDTSRRLSRDGAREHTFQPRSPVNPRVPWAFIAAAVFLLVVGATVQPAAPDIGADIPATIPLGGRVIDAGTKAPIPAATVRVVDEGFRQRANDQGRFTFAALPPGTYRLHVSAVGFAPVVTEPIEVLSYRPHQVTVELVAKPHTLDDIVVSAARPEAATPVIRITRDMIRETRVTSVPELLSLVPGLYVQSAGPGGEARVRIRGSDAAQVLVLVDGQRINPSGSGVADLSSVPLEMVEEIEVHTGGASAEFGPDAMAGAINIKTRRTPNSSGISGLLETGVGGFNSRRLRTSLSNPVSSDRLESIFSYSREMTDGDFSYDYSVDGVGGQSDTVLSGERQNNQSQSSNLFGAGTYVFSPQADLSYSFQRFEAVRGLPGTVDRIDSTGESADERLLATVSMQLSPGRQGTMESMLGFSRLSEQFANRDSAVHAANRYDSRFLNEILTFRQSYAGRLGQSLDQRVTLEFRRDRLFHDDLLRPQFSMGRADRTNWGLGWSAGHRTSIAWSVLFDRLTTDLSVRYDRADTRSDRAATAITPAGRSHVTEAVSPLVGIAISGRRGAGYRLSASYGKSLRLPGLNALFWRGDSRSAGNPDLRPEKSEHSEMSLELSGTIGPAALTGAATYFHSAVTDLVVWQPNFQGAWQPNNVGRTLITGHEESLELALFSRAISVRYRNSVTDAINKLPQHTVNGKRLPFYPRYLSTVSAQVRYRGWSVAYQTHFVGRTYTNEANTRSYDAYSVTDLRLGLDIRLTARWEIGARCAIDNLTDEQYVLLAQYPMPGRHAEASLTITYGLDKE
jgi:outer membrane cobalamin receptor